MSWRFVFNSEYLGPGKTARMVSNMAEKAGYSFFTFNGEVYFVNCGIWYKTPLKVTDLF